DDRVRPRATSRGAAGALLPRRPSTILYCRSPGAETALSNRRLLFDGHVVDTRARRAAADPRYQRVDGLRGALENRLDCSVRLVPHPARDAARPRALGDRPPKADTLDPSADRHTHARRVSQTRIPPPLRAAR